VQKTLLIVLELASTGWKDSPFESDASLSLSAGADNSGDDGGGSGGGGGGESGPLSSAELDGALPPEGAALIRALLARARYGGLKGDVAMLQLSSRVWLRRLSAPSAADARSLALLQGAACTGGGGAGTSGGGSGCGAGGAGGAAVEPCAAWVRALRLAARAHAKGPARAAVAAMVGSRNAELSANDCTPAGVDFHCSPVLDCVLADPSFRRGAQGLGGGLDGERLLERARTLMWERRSSTNLKRSISSSASTNINSGGAEKEEVALGDAAQAQQNNALWRLLSPLVEEFSAKYIYERLAR